ncbi:hypothetical protein AK812_SmicGene23917 [Symbiodinium microadriaticum]|uniref:Uncharacterized protein n=1 Tax=Symbiodinium microadriaticum TaxID=2951 RepID=A0A1Q9DFX1_SYMMI|nr:hypothetical protein AK812_SmicGene23917 [Symbiodinium microadriaticum]CAE7406727.1 unnamed protein product [Symbiodinium microadriaticum]
MGQVSEIEESSQQLCSQIVTSIAIKDAEERPICSSLLTIIEAEWTASAPDPDGQEEASQDVVLQMEVASVAIPELSLEFTDGALVIADDADVHRDEKYATLRKLWEEEENNCILLGCDRQHPVQVPGGFGAAGAANDQWHNAWRLLRRAWLRKADVYARQCLRQHRSGNIIMAAWHRLGYIDVEELAKRKLGGDLDQLDAALSHVPHSMATLLNLDALPDLGLVAAAEELDNSKVLDALIGCKHVWWFHDEEDLCRPLPDWLNKGGKDGGKLLTIHLSRGEEWPQALDMPQSLLQDAPSDVVPATVEAEPAELHGEEIFLEGDEVAPGEQPQAAWDCVWVTASKHE